MTTCPYCNEQAMSLLRKSFLGPALTIQCKACSERVSVPPAAMLAVVPFLFSIILAALLFPKGWQFGALSLLAGFAAMAAIHALLVPLVRRGT